MKICTYVHVLYIRVHTYTQYIHTYVLYVDVCSSSLSADTPALREYFLPDCERSALRLILLALHQLELLLQPEGEGFLGEVTIEVGGILCPLPLIHPSIHSPLQTQDLTFKIRTSTKITYTHTQYTFKVITYLRLRLRKLL